MRYKCHINAADGGGGDCPGIPDVMTDSQGPLRAWCSLSCVSHL
jgi:hypothetical protein